MATPEGWTRASYEHAADINPESIDRGTEDGDVIEYLDLGSVDRPGHIGTTQTLRFGDAPSRARRRARAHDTLVSTVRPYLRSFAYLEAAAENLVVSTGFAVLRAKRGVDPRFLYQTVLSDPFVAFLTTRQTGSNYPAVGARDVSDAPIVLPPLPEQRKIAAILSSVDEVIEKTEEVIEQLQVVNKAMMQELLTRGLPGRHTRFKQTVIGEVPEKWNLTTPGRVARFSGGHGFRPPDWASAGLPIIRIQNLNGSSDFNYFDGAPEPEWVVEPGELLFAWAGSIGASFGPCLWPGPRGVLNQHIYRITPGPDADQHYFYFLLRLITAEVEKRAHGFKQTLVHLKKAELTDRPIALPPLREQHEIVERLVALEDRTDAEESVLAAQRALKATLMSALLTGELRVTPDEGAA